LHDNIQEGNMKDSFVISSIGLADENEDVNAVLVDYGLKPKDVRRLTLGESRLLVSCFRALKKGKLENAKHSRGGIIAGSNWGNVESGFSEEEAVVFDGDYDKASFLSLFKFISSMPTNRCSIFWGLNSVSVTFGGGENSGIKSIIEASRQLKMIGNMNMDFILAGSFEVINRSRLKIKKILNSHPLKSILFRLVLSTKLFFKKTGVFRYLWKPRDNESPLNGGAGCILIEKLESAKTRGADILGIIKGYSQAGIPGRLDVKLLGRQMSKILADAGNVDAVISIHHLSKKRRKIEKRILKKNGFTGKFYPADDIVGENFSFSDVAAVAFATSLFNSTNFKNILINSFGQHSYSGILLARYNG